VQLLAAKPVDVAVYILKAIQQRLPFAVQLVAKPLLTISMIIDAQVLQPTQTLCFAEMCTSVLWYISVDWQP